MSDTMTPRHRQVYDFIRQYIQRESFPPTIREIGAGVGLSSTQSVNVCLHKMKELGYLTFEPYASRTIKLLEVSDAATSEA